MNNITNSQIDGLVQERRNSIANALELRLSYTNPSQCEFTDLDCNHKEEKGVGCCFSLKF